MFISGVVVHGRALGRTLGFPTANIIISPDAHLENGVYLSWVELEGIRHKAISNVGVKPTVGGSERMVESYILEFEGNLYGREITVELSEKLRDEIHFDTLEQLQEQIKLDIETVRNLK